MLTEATTVGELQKIIREGSREEAAPYPYPRWQQRWPLRWLHVALLYALVLPATRILGKPKVMGKERLRNLRGPALFVCNHVTAVDHALILLALPGRFRRRMSIAMDGERLRGLRRPPRGTGLAMRLYLLLQYILAVFFFDVFSMPRMSGFRRSFAFAGEMMDRGRSILVFPEGRFTEDGSMGPFMPGTGLLISELGAPVVPMRIDGLWKLKEARRRRAKRGEITVSIGEPASYSLHGEAGQIALDLERRVKAL